MSYDIIKIVSVSSSFFSKEFIEEIRDKEEWEDKILNEHIYNIEELECFGLPLEYRPEVRKIKSVCNMNDTTYFRITQEF
jgi:hypothetical protein